MTRMIMVIVVLVGLAGLIVGGCVNVPKGPYVTLDNGGKSSPSQTPGNAAFTKEFLKDARDDGVITKAQYDALCKRLADCD